MQRSAAAARSLAVALTYSNIVFAGVILIWLFNTLANIIRGTGNTLVPGGGDDRRRRAAGAACRRR